MDNRELSKKQIEGLLETIPNENADIMGIEMRQKAIIRGKTLLNLITHQAPDALVELQQSKFEDSLSDWNSPEMIQQVREDLENLSPQAKEEQNRIINTCLVRTGSSKFLDTMIKPRRTEHDTSPEELLLEQLFGIPHKKDSDYISRLIEKDNSGNYVVPNKTVANFIDWYHKSIAQLEKGLGNIARKSEKAFVSYVKQAIDDKLLPESFLDNIERLDEESSQYDPPTYTISDYSSNEKNSYSGLCESTYAPVKNSPLWLKLINHNDEHLIAFDLLVLYHEYMHYVVNDTLFIRNPKVNTIINEGLTETLSSLAIHLRHPQMGEYQFGMGNVYPIERSTIVFLQSGGKKTIDPKIIIEAHAKKPSDSFLQSITEKDGFLDWYTEKYTSIFGDVPKEFISVDIHNSIDQNFIIEFATENHIYRPEEERFFEAVYQAFPSCKTPDDIERLIENKYDEIAQLAK